MKLQIGVLLTLLLASPAAHAGTLWYNGDFDGVDGTVSVRHGFGLLDVDAFVYENVTLAGSANVTGVFGTFLHSGATPVGAEYEIRTGVSAGDGGTLVASGSVTSGFSWVDLATTFNSPSYGTLGVFRLDIGASVSLAAGQYWVGIRPIADSASDVVALLATTSGTNAVGTPAGNDGNSFLDSATLGFAFDPLQTDFSAGLTDDAVTGVPEPSSFVLAGLGLLAATTARARARRP